MLGVVFFDQDYDQEGVVNINGALYLIISILTFVNLFCILQVALKKIKKGF